MRRLLRSPPPRPASVSCAWPSPTPRSASCRGSGWTSASRSTAQLHTAGYSITTSPIHPGEIELAIKASAHHPVARWVHEQARVGDAIRISPRPGAVCLPAGDERQRGADRRRRRRHAAVVHLPPCSRRQAADAGRIWSTACRTAAKSCSAKNSKPPRASHDNLHVSLTVTQPDPLLARPHRPDRPGQAACARRA